METTVQALRRVSFLAGLADDALTLVASVATRRTYAPGETVIFEGDPCQAAYFIAAGQVRVYRLSPGGREQVLTRLVPGQTFNTVPPFQPHGVNHATVEALTAVTLYAIPCSELRRLVGECPGLALAVLQDFAARLDHLTDLVEDLSLRTVRGRLARFLLEHASTELGGTAEEGQVARRWTQEEIAAHLGTVRDMVGRTLRAFTDAGLLRMDRDGLEAETQRRRNATFVVDRRPLFC